MKHLLNLLLLLTLICTPVMAYSTNSDLADAADEKQVVQLVDDEVTNLSTIEDIEAAADDAQHEYHSAAVKMISRIEQARSTADELINTFLRGRYEVPIQPVPAMIADLSNDLTKHYLYKRRGGINMTEEAKALKADSIATLKLIQAGTIKISDSPDVGAGHFKSNKTKDDRLFNDDLLSRY